MIKRKAQHRRGGCLQAEDSLGVMETVRGEERRNKVQEKLKSERIRGFPGGAVVKNVPANAEDMGSSPGPGRSHMPQST